MGIEKRIKYINQLANRFDCKKITDLMLEVKVPNNLFHNISIATKTYVSKCIDINNVILDDEKLINKFIINKGQVKNITPNGIIVPKNIISLEFNLLLKSYVEIIKFLNIEDLISNFHFPPNLRVKYGTVDKQNLNRKHPTENMHSDTWTGANPNWIAVHCFILGDINRNHIRYAQPPDNFNENWLKPLKNAKVGADIVKQYKLIKYTPKKGSLIIADASVIHQSYRKNNAGLRISLDTGFDMKMKGIKSLKENKIKNIDVKKLRYQETITKSQFLNVGSKTYFHFPDQMGIKVHSKGGFKHPSNVKLVELPK